MPRPHMELYHNPMIQLLPLLLGLLVVAMAADLPTRKYLNLAAIKTIVAAAELEPRPAMFR